MIIEWLRKCWKVVVMIPVVAGTIGGIMVLPTYVATPADLEKVKADTKQTIQELKKSIELDRDITRLNQVNDSLMKAKIQQRQYPRDKDLQEDIESLKADKEKLQKRIEKR